MRKNTTKGRIQIVWLLSIPAGLVGLMLSVTYQSPYLIETVGYFFSFLAFLVVGSLIVSRQPENTIGALFLMIASGYFLSSFSSEYATLALMRQPGRYPAGLFFAVLTGVSGLLVWGLLPTFTLLLFPDGRIPSKRLRPLLWLNVIILGLFSFSTIFRPGMFDPVILPVENPLGFEPLRPFLERYQTILFMAFTAVMSANVASLVYRYRRSNLENRYRIKWFAFACAILALMYLVSMLGTFIDIPGFHLASMILWPVAIASLPIAVGNAILRYRLYDIDLVIRRTLVYGILTVALALVYFGAVIILQTLFSGISGGERSQLAIVLSTLAIAALFNPLRRRVQSAIDKRFYRHRYDSDAILAEFSISLRNEVHLETLSERLIDVVRQTVQPESVSLWLAARGEKGTLNSQGRGSYENFK